MKLLSGAVIPLLRQGKRNACRTTGMRDSLECMRTPIPTSRLGTGLGVEHLGVDMRVCCATYITRVQLLHPRAARGRSAARSEHRFSLLLSGLVSQTVQHNCIPFPKCEDRRSLQVPMICTLASGAIYTRIALDDRLACNS